MAMKNILLLLSIILLSSCRRDEINAYVFQYPNGDVGWATECETIPRCYQTASRVCRGGYRVIDSKTTQESRFTGELVGDSASAFYRSGDTITFTFACP